MRDFLSHLSSIPFDSLSSDEVLLRAQEAKEAFLQSENVYVQDFLKQVMCDDAMLLN
jgi:hypothetical protein